MSEVVVDRTTCDRLMAGDDTVLIKDEAGVLTVARDELADIWVAATTASSSIPR